MEMRDDGMLWDGEDGPFCPGCAADGRSAHVSKNPANGYWVVYVMSEVPGREPSTPAPVGQ